MKTSGTVAAAESDGTDRLLRAGEPLASLQLACGGELPGTIAIPELLALVRRARQHGTTLRGVVHAHALHEAVSFRVEARPQDAGCALDVTEWTTAPLPPLDPTGPPPTRAETAAQSALGPDLADQLRPPLGAIIAHAEAIRSCSAGPMAEQYAVYGGDIAQAGRHMLGLVEDLADLAMIEGEGFATAADPFDLAELARRAIGMLRQAADERGIVMVPPAEATCWPARGDQRRVLQILLNLVGNAVRYAPSGSTVRIDGDRLADRSEVTVSNSAPVLDPAAQAKVFDKFERLGRGEDGGSGLGLYISRRLARAMGGDLSVASARGEGTRFTLELSAA